MLRTPADLNETDLLKIAMEAVGLSIYGDTLTAREHGHEIREGFLFGDQGSAMNFSGITRSPAWRALGSRT